jgi:hypothetical protein
MEAQSGPLTAEQEHTFTMWVCRQDPAILEKYGFSLTDPAIDRLIEKANNKEEVRIICRAICNAVDYKGLNRINTFK